MTMQKLGTLYPKKYFYNEVPADGAELVLCGLIVPKFLVARKYWMNVMIGTQEGAAAVPPDAKVTYRIVGRSAVIPANLDVDAAAVDTWLEKKIAFAPIGAVTFEGDEAAVNMQDVGMIGGVAGFTGPKDSIFFTREKVLGLPKNAVFTDADSILMQDAFSTQGRISRKHSSVDEINMLIWGITVESDEQGSSSDVTSQVGSATGQFADLSADAVAFFDGPSDVLQISDPSFSLATSFPQLEAWLRFGFNNGFTPDLFAEDAELTTRVRLTVQCDVLVPGGARSLSGP